MRKIWTIKYDTDNNIVCLILLPSARRAVWPVAVGVVTTTIPYTYDRERCDMILFCRRRRGRRTPETGAEGGTTANCRVKERRMTETANCFLPAPKILPHHSRLVAQRMSCLILLLLLLLYTKCAYYIVRPLPCASVAIIIILLIIVFFLFSSFPTFTAPRA